MENYRDIIKAPIITEKKLNRLLRKFLMLKLKMLIQLILMQKEKELDVILAEPTK